MECDSIYDVYKSTMYIYKNGEISELHNVLSVKASYTEKNLDKLQEIKDHHTYFLKEKCKNTAIGFFAAGAAMIFMGNIAADIYLNNKTDNLYRDFASGSINQTKHNENINKAKNTSRAIRYASTGLGTIFEIVGICKTIQLSSGSAFTYKIKNDGFTLTYKFR